MALTREGRAWAAGWTRYGQLGDGTQSDSRKFTQVISNEAKTLTAGEIHSMMLKQDGSVLWAAGRNANVQLGDGSKRDSMTFAKIISGGASHVAAGGYHSMVVKQDESVWATGLNKYYGQLGDGSTKDRIKFGQVAGSEWGEDYCCWQSTQHDAETIWQCVDHRLQPLLSARGWLF